MFALTQTEVYTGTIQRDCTRQRMKLAIALFDLELAHDALAELEPSDHQYEERAEQLKSALQHYWHIDRQVERFLHTTRSTR